MRALLPLALLATLPAIATAQPSPPAAALPPEDQAMVQMLKEAQSREIVALSTAYSLNQQLEASQAKVAALTQQLAAAKAAPSAAPAAGSSAAPESTPGEH